METSKQPGVTNSAEVAAAEVEASDEQSLKSASEQFAPTEKQNLDQSAQVATQETSRTSARNCGGPRTTQGKQKSKYNALKLGILSQVVLLKGEPRAEFDSLSSKLRDDREPEKKIEDTLVDKLAELLWRRRRLIIAGGTKIRKGTDFFEFNKKQNKPKATN